MVGGNGDGLNSDGRLADAGLGGDLDIDVGLSCNLRGRSLCSNLDIDLGLGGDCENH